MNDNNLSPGTAKTSISQDDLGRAAFVSNLASVIRTYGKLDSLTIGLYGPWGCGKSTLLNFVIENLSQYPDDIAILRFNPWNFSQQDTLVSTFFASISALIKRSDKSKKAKKAAALLETFSAVTAPLVLAPGLGVVPQTLKQLSDAARDYADVFSDVDASKAAISDALVRSPRRYVIVIDDIDRLTEPEIRLMFQLVKSMADFKNVVYVMAFDRNIVAKALDPITGGEGYAYLEKIVNVPVDVPPLTGRQVQRILTLHLTAYSERQREYNWSNKRLEALMPIAVRGFSTVRQIERFINALAIVEGLTKADVDFTDLIAFTILKALEPKLHDFIASHPELFVDDLANRFLAKDDQDEFDRKAIEAAFADLQTLSHEDATEVLSIVFPRVTRVFKRYGASKHWGDPQWRREFRACADYKMFARYFLLRVDEGDISAKDRDAFWSSLTSVESFEAFLSSIDDTERLYRTMEYVGDLTTAEITKEQILLVVTSLLDVADDFDELPFLADIFLGPGKAALDAINHLVLLLPADERLEVFLSALQHPPRGLVTTAIASSRLTSERVGTFSPQQSAPIRQQLGHLLDAAWHSGSLQRSKRVLYLIREWLDSSSDAPEIIKQTLKDDDKALLEFLSHYENVQTSDSWKPSRFWYKGLQEIYALPELAERLHNIELADIEGSSHARDLRNELEHSLGASGQPIDEGEDSEDEDDDDPGL